MECSMCKLEELDSEFNINQRPHAKIDWRAAF